MTYFFMTTEQGLVVAVFYSPIDLQYLAMCRKDIYTAFVCRPKWWQTKPQVGRVFTGPKTLHWCHQTGQQGAQKTNPRG